MRFTTTVAVAALVVAPTLSVVAQGDTFIDQIEKQFSGEEDLTLFQGDIVAPYSQISRLFSKETADAALADNSVAIDDSATMDDEGRRLGTPANRDVKLWNGAVIPYSIDQSYIDSSFSNATGVTPEQSVQNDIANVTLAIETLSIATGVSFRPRNSGDTNWVSVVGGRGCSSNVGESSRRGGQRLTLQAPTAESRGTCRRTGTIIHEFLHALGLFHQQSMKNRDKRLIIYRERIEADKFYNWDKFQSSVDFFATDADPEGTAVYSYGSLMHYGKTAFARVRNTTVMEAIDTFEDGTFEINDDKTALMGQRTKLDATDAIEIQIMYHCHKINPNDGLSANFPVDNIRDLCTDRCQCALLQGGCKQDSHCEGSAVCVKNVGVYEHLGQRLELAGLNACLASQSPTLEPTTPPPTLEPTTPPPSTARPTTESTGCDCKGTSGQYETCGPYQDTTVCLVQHPGGPNDPPPCDAPGGATYTYSTNFNSWYTFGCEEEPPVVVTLPPVTQPSDCDCQGTSGTFESCAPYQGDTVCLINFNGGPNESPPCTAPAGGNFGYSTNFNSWYVFGCTVVSRSAAKSSANPLALVNALVDEEEVSKEESPVVMIAAIGAAVVGVAAIALVVIKKQSAQGGQVVAAEYQVDTTKGESHASGNPRFGMVEEL